MGLQFDSIANLVKVTVDMSGGGYDNVASVIGLTAGLGVKLPTPPFQMTWWNSTDYPNPEDDPNVEIVRVGAVSGDTMTLSRGQENIVATTKNTAGKTYTLILTPTALTLANIANGLTALYESIQELQGGVSGLVGYLVSEGFDVPDELLIFLE